MRHAFFVRARTCTLFRVRDKTMLVEPFPLQAPTGCAKSRQSRCSLSSASPRVSSAARTNRSAAVVHLQYLLRCAVCIVFYFHTSKRKATSLGEHGMWTKGIVQIDLSSIINSRKTGPTLAIGWPTTYTGSTTNITKRVANRQHCHSYKRNVVYKRPKCYLTYPAKEYQSHCIYHINSIDYTLPDI